MVSREILEIPVCSQVHNANCLPAMMASSACFSGLKLLCLSATPFQTLQTAKTRLTDSGYQASLPGWTLPLNGAAQRTG